MRRPPGDAAAFEELFRRHRRTVIADAARRCSQPLTLLTWSLRPFWPCWREAPATTRLGGVPVVVDRCGIPSAHGLAPPEDHQSALGRAVSGQPVLDEDATARLEARIDAARDSGRGRTRHERADGPTSRGAVAARPRRAEPERRGPSPRRERRYVPGSPVAGPPGSGPRHGQPTPDPTPRPDCSQEVPR